MSRVFTGILYVLGLLAALVAVWNIHTRQWLIGQVIIGAIGIVLALFFVVTIQEHPRVQRAALFGLLLLEVLMLAPVVWLAFTGGDPSVMQLATGAAGAVLMFISWRMLPR